MTERRSAPRLSRVALLTAGLAVAVSGLTACGPGWWTAMPTEEPSAEVVATSDVVASPEASVDLGPAPTLDVTATELPTLWNEMAQANGLSDTLPDPLVADDTIDGVSSVTVPIGDGTLFIQWQDSDGKVLSLQLDTTVDGDPTTSSVVPVLEALAHAALGQSTADAPTFVATTLSDAVANAIDPTFIDWTVQSGSADLGISIVAGLASIMVNPHLDDGLDDATSDAASPAESAVASPSAS